MLYETNHTHVMGVFNVVYYAYSLFIMVVGRKPDRFCIDIRLLHTQVSKIVGHFAPNILILLSGQLV